MHELWLCMLYAFHNGLTFDYRCFRRGVMAIFRIFWDSGADFGAKSRFFGFLPGYWPKIKILKFSLLNLIIYTKIHQKKYGPAKSKKKVMYCPPLTWRAKIFGFDMDLNAWKWPLQTSDTKIHRNTLLSTIMS